MATISGVTGLTTPTVIAALGSTAMKFANTRAISAFGAPIAIGALVLTSCGGGEAGGATASTVNLSQASTEFVVRPPQPPGAPDGAGGSDELLQGRGRLQPREGLPGDPNSSRDPNGRLL